MAQSDSGGSMRKSIIVAADLQKERDAMTRIWKKREAQLTRMSTGMLSMVGDLLWIGQGAVEQLAAIAALSSSEEVKVS